MKIRLLRIFISNNIERDYKLRTIKEEKIKKKSKKSVIKNIKTKTSIIVLFVELEGIKPSFIIK